MKITTLGLLLALGLMSAKDRAWQTGTLQETASASHTVRGADVVVMGSPAPTYGNPSVGAAQGYASSAAAVAASRSRLVRLQGYRIEGNGYSFMVYCDVTRRVPNVTVHGPIKYALDDGTFYFQDEDHREFKATVMEKALVPAAPPAAPKP